jgi:DNA repair exonuclease SbcCD ATPase subunit
MATIQIFLLSPPFGLFKKKDDSREAKNVDRSRNKLYTADSLTVLDALKFLQQIESEKIKNLANNLLPIKESVVKSLESIEKVANNLERENIKLEELRFKSIVENSKRTLVAALKREASSDLPLPQSMQDIKKFKDRLESIMDRFSEVSGSHSRVMNVFMKKYAGKLKSDFEIISSLLKKTKSIMAEFEEENAVIVRCTDTLNMLSQKAQSIKAKEDKIENINNEIEMFRRTLDQLKNQLNKLENSTQFKESSSKMQEINVLEKEKEIFQNQMLDLYSHVSRAFTKYSYGMTKDTLARLKVLVEEPWKIFYDPDISKYISTLVEVQKAVASDKIKLKDSEKVLHYMNIILESLPDYQGKARAIKHQLKLLYENSDIDTLNKSNELRESIRNYNKKLEDLELLLNQLRKQIAETRNDLDTLVKQAEGYISEITGKKYSLSI